MVDDALAPVPYEEVRDRDRRIAELEAENADLQRKLDTYNTRYGGNPIETISRLRKRIHQVAAAADARVSEIIRANCIGYDLVRLIDEVEAERDEAWRLLNRLVWEYVSHECWKEGPPPKQATDLLAEIEDAKAKREVERKGL